MAPDPASDTRRVLVVEDSALYAKRLQQAICALPGFEAVAAGSLAQARDILARDTGFFVSLVDLELQDGAGADTVDLAIRRNVPPVILTSDFSRELRENILTRKKVVDYLYKQETSGFTTITDLLGRLVANQGVKVLVAEDSSTQRFQLTKMLQAQKYQVLQAPNGDEAFQLAEANPDIRVVITDYNMPVVDGFELVGLLRSRFDKDRLAIIGLSAQGNSFLAARFLKAGATDFLTKPVFSEELMARVSRNVEYLEMVGRLKDLAIKDPLTMLYNRRHFYDAGEALFHACRERGRPMSVSMLDIDYFKKINDEHGHHTGDDVLRRISAILLECTRGADIVSRFGGEEFCILAADTDATGARILFEKIRQRVQDLNPVINGAPINVTISIGIANGDFISLSDMIRHADIMLYQAKDQGRNRIVMA